MSLYEGDVLYLAQSQTSALVLVADAQLPYRNVGFGSIPDLFALKSESPQTQQERPVEATKSRRRGASNEQLATSAKPDRSLGKLAQ